jgi:hypothetical protein
MVKINNATVKRFLEGAKMDPAEKARLLSLCAGAGEHEDALRRLLDAGQRAAKSAGGSGHSTKEQQPPNQG